MKKLLIIAVAILVCGVEAEAQLLVDSNARLKTTKVKSEGKRSFRGKKVRTGPGGDKKKVLVASRPRYTPGRVSFRTKGVSPRFSPGSPFRGAQYKVHPRYSHGNPFRGSDFKVSPRFSHGNPFRGRDFKVSPRFSPGMPFRSQDYKVSPRYSQGNPFRGADFKVNPRFSNPKHRFETNERARKYANYSNDTYFFRGHWKMKKRGPGDQHPSSNYHFAARFSNAKVRKMFRKWNIFWTRTAGNKEEPKGVKASVRSPKFDKKEKDIWNN